MTECLVATTTRLERYRMTMDQIRGEEYPMMATKTYLDHAGTTIPAKSMLKATYEDLVSNLYGNPHSEHNDSVRTSRKVDAVRRQTLRFFKADPAHFDVIFVANASAAIKLVGECFRDASEKKKKGFWLGYHRDCHTSVVGLREASKGRHHCFKDDRDVNQWINAGAQFNRDARRQRSKDQLGLFAYPGQSNMTGRRLPLSWSENIRASHLQDNMYTLLDAAGLATSCQIDLSDPRRAPDFMTVSFYKIFGGPNLGALIVRKVAGDVLRFQKDFGGGSVDMVISMGATWHAKKSELHDRMEYGTLPFQSIIQLGHAFNAHQKIYGSMDAISKHTTSLTRLLYRALTSLRHSNGRNMVVVYNDVQDYAYGNALLQGGNIAFNLIDQDGYLVGYTDVEKRANDYNISIRSGSLCNPGGFAHYLNWSPEEMKRAYEAGHRCSNPTQLMNGKPTGVVRVSLGAMSNVTDVDKFIWFIRNNYYNMATTSTARSHPIRHHNSCNNLGMYCDKAVDSATETLRSFDLASSSSEDDPIKTLRARVSLAQLHRPSTARSWVGNQFSKLNSRSKMPTKIAA
ncbi:PLP-dependent transferase [Pseudovirgaria hyperparasitica]|uniref:PLP-dependent transferase n=1 Tax=Pseudovirgaria hyperparasitica TaxID=470096 RepID=A0A6A6WEJ0_9PEZI|nr:PLP-dependent transferase [Pseudovirgaria hyperparasitica]KAF2760410.1 PLP-dependent transferase [Pseudovirgaria hyperparasitica]